ncbi:MAG: hypothetical protein ACRD96_17600 [Bryobacteraceae bacterium]
MRAVVLALLAGLAASAQNDNAAAAILRRVAEEAEVFQSVARDLIAEEKLEHRSRKPASRFRPRIGKAAEAPAVVQYQTREIISEYAYGALAEAPGALHEFRQVIAIDGRPLVRAEKARQTLTLGVRSGSDKVKKKMLQDFEKHGLVGAATDFGQMILLFTKRRLPRYRFSVVKEAQIGADAAVVLSYREAGESLTIFSGRSSIRKPLEGELWVRKSDSLPLRITMVAAREEDDQTVRDEATVEYEPSAYGVVLPVSVLHRETAGDQLVAENRFRYASFRRFGAQSEVKFDVAEPKPAERKP